MTVSAAPALAGPFDGNDVATSFPFDFKIFDESDLRVVLRDALTAEYLLTLDVDYSVSMNPDQNADPGGTITYPLSGPPLATGERLTVTTDLELSQQTVFTNLGKFFPATVEDTFDRVTMLLRQIQAESVRGLRVPVSLSDVLTDLPTPVAGAALVWNEDGTALVNGIPSESLIAISSFMANVIQAVDAAEARSDIGAAADTAVVKLTGDQTIAGVKTFSSSPVIPDGAAAQNPVSKAQLDAEAVARAAAISAAVAPATLAPTLSDDMGADVPTTSGTSHMVSDIPSWALCVHIDLLGISVSGTDNFGFQVGNSGGFVTSGYAGGVSGGTNAVAFSNAFTTMQSNAPAGVWEGQITLRRARATDTTWSYAATANRSDGPSVAHVGAGSVTINNLDRVRIAMLSGSSTFDAGSFRVRAGI